VKAFIFDLDGVLVFTDKFRYKAWKQTADKLGMGEKTSLIEEKNNVYQQ
jgi:beta-phosphoglucomutase